MIVSADVRNRLADDVMVVPIFSRGAAGPTHVRLIRGARGIKRDSVLFCEELTTLDRDLLTHGPLGAPVDAHVLAAVLCERSGVHLAKRCLSPSELARLTSP